MGRGALNVGDPAWGQFAFGWPPPDGREALDLGDGALGCGCPLRGEAGLRRGGLSALLRRVLGWFGAKRLGGADWGREKLGWGAWEGAPGPAAPPLRPLERLEPFSRALSEGVRRPELRLQCTRCCRPLIHRSKVSEGDGMDARGRPGMGVGVRVLGTAHLGAFQ